VIVSVPIEVNRLNGRQMILAAYMVFVAQRDMARRIDSSTTERVSQGMVTVLDRLSV
jgi:hypothetical protein